MAATDESETSSVQSNTRVTYQFQLFVESGEGTFVSRAGSHSNSVFGAAGDSPKSAEPRLRELNSEFMVTAKSEWDTTLSLAFRPRLLLQGIVEYISGWFFTRNWLWMLVLYSPAAIIVGAAAGVVGYGAFLSQETLVQRYSEWIDEELPLALSALEEEGGEEALSDVPADESATGSSESKGEPSTEESQSASEPTESSDTSPSEADLESVSAFGELLLRRLLQLNQDNSRATFLVSLQLARQGRSGQARQMMRRIGPEGGGGFPPAHAWLAADLVQNKGLNTPQDWMLFQGDMKSALDWPLTNPQLLSFYANTLAGLEEADPVRKRRNVDRALEVLADAAKQHPELRIALANLASVHGRKQRLGRVTDDAKQEIRQRMEDGTETPEDLISLANLFLLELEPDKTLKVCQMGLESGADIQVIRRMQSEAYRIKYLQSATWDGQNAQVDLSLLDAALKSDPTNPGVSVEIAKLIAAGKDAPPELKESLQERAGKWSSDGIDTYLVSGPKSHGRKN